MAAFYAHFQMMTGHGKRYKLYIRRVSTVRLLFFFPVQKHMLWMFV